MPYKPFEESTLWQHLTRLHLHIHQSVSPMQSGLTEPIKNSLLNTSLRASQMLAEGQETSYGADQLPHLYQVRAALIEIRNSISIIQQHSPQSPQRREFDTLQEETDKCARMLHGWIETIKNPAKKKGATSPQEAAPASTSTSPLRNPERPRPERPPGSPSGTYRNPGPAGR